MLQTIRQLLTKLSCHHDYEKLHITSYRDCDVILIKCRKCGRIRKITT